jgi:hypothetical protein
MKKAIYLRPFASGGEDVLVLTEAAKRHLAAMLDIAGAETDVAVRLAWRDGRWVVRFDREAPGDESFDYEGRIVLVLAQDAAEALEGDSLLEVHEVEEGKDALKLTCVR